MSALAVDLQRQRIHISHSTSYFGLPDRGGNPVCDHPHHESAAKSLLSPCHVS